MQTITVNMRINGIPRHAQRHIADKLPKSEIKLIRQEMVDALHLQWDNIFTDYYTAQNQKIPQEFKDYHNEQKEEYGYVKYRVEFEERVHGRNFFSVQALYKSGSYGPCKLNYVEIDEIRKFINNNKVEVSDEI